MNYIRILELLFSYICFDAIVLTAKIGVDFKGEWWMIAAKRAQ